MPAPKRGEIVRLIGDELRAHKDALGTLVTLEMGKIKPEGDGEVQEMIDIADFAVGQSRMLYGLTMHSERPQHRMYEQWHPLGVVGIISAFNFPGRGVGLECVPRRRLRRCLRLEASPKTPLCAVAVQRSSIACSSARPIPASFSSSSTADNELAEQFVDDRRVDLVSFTGSTAVGKQVGERVAARLGKSLLELGGNNAIIVDEFANLDLAVPSIVFGAVGTAGQRCTSTRRVFVHASRAARARSTAVARVCASAHRRSAGDRHAMGPLIDERCGRPLSARAIEAAKRAGGTVLCGGKVLDRPGQLRRAHDRARDATIGTIVQTETFAPILYLIEFESLDEAIAMHNAVASRPVVGDLHGQPAARGAFPAATGSDCGIANVNIGTSGAEIGGAFGGEKDTGGGRESGSDAGRPTCAGRPTRSIGAASCRWRRASISKSHRRAITSNSSIDGGRGGVTEIAPLDASTSDGRYGRRKVVDCRPPVLARQFVMQLLRDLPVPVS